MEEIKRFWGDKQKAERAARKINIENKNSNTNVYKFGGLYFIGTKEDYDKL